MVSQGLLRRLKRQRMELQMLANKQRLAAKKHQDAKNRERKANLERKKLQSDIKKLRLETSKDFLSKTRRALAGLSTNEDIKKHKSRLKSGFAKFQKWADSLPKTEL